MGIEIVSSFSLQRGTVIFFLCLLFMVPAFTQGVHEVHLDLSFHLLNVQGVSLAGRLGWWEVESSVPGQGPQLGCGFDLLVGAYLEGNQGVRLLGQKVFTFTNVICTNGYPSNILKIAMY